MRKINVITKVELDGVLFQVGDKVNIQFMRSGKLEGVVIKQLYGFGMEFQDNGVCGYSGIESIERVEGDSQEKDLKKALYMLLNEIGETDDLKPKSDTDFFIDMIVEALAKEEEKHCPFENYGMKKFCSKTDGQHDCKHACQYDDFESRKEVWVDFIKNI